jgi:hypothetical protein
METIKMQFFNDVKTILTNPKEFFTKVKEDDDYVKPIIFLMKILAFTIPLTFIFGTLIPTFLGFNSETIQNLPFSLDENTFIIISLFILPLSFLLYLGFSFVGAGFYHLLLMLMGTTKSYVQTYKLYCYWSVIYFFKIFFVIFNLFILYFQVNNNHIMAGFVSLFFLTLYIPYFIYSFFIAINGTVVLHNISFGKAITAIVIIPIILITILFVIAIMFFAILFSVITSDLMVANVISNII